MPERNGLRAPFNVVAAFSREDDAGVAVDALATRGVPPMAITMHRPDENEDGDESADSEASRAFGAAFTLGLLGIVVGVLTGLAWAYVFSSGFSPAPVVALAGVAGLAGAPIGFGVGGPALKRRLSEEPGAPAPPAAGRDVLVALHICDCRLAERTAALLRGLGAERVDLFDARGTPLPWQVSERRGR
jgi:hypothetical protein